MTPELQTLEIALKERHSDAYERASALAVKYAQEAGTHLQRARISVTAGHRAQQKHSADMATTWLDRMEAIDVLLAEHGGWVPAGDHGPTAELLNQIRNSRAGDPVLRLVARGALTYADLRDAVEIANVVRYSSARLEARTTRFPTEQLIDEEPAGRPADAGEWYGLLHARVFEPWRMSLVGSGDLELVMGLLIDGEAIEALRKKHGMRWATALGRITEALKVYRKLRGRVSGTRAP